MNNELFESRRKKPAAKKAPKVIYDVKVTWNRYTEKKTQKVRTTIRFAFHNKASKIFEPGKFIRVTRVDSDNPVLKNAIYFVVSDEKVSRDWIMVQSTSNATNRRSSCAAITPHNNEEKIFRCRWAGKAFELQFDPNRNLFYISLDKTVGNIAPEGDAKQMHGWDELI